MTQDTEHGYLSKARRTDWRPALPVLLLLLVYHLWMPPAPVGWENLATYQHVIASTAVPTIFGSMYWFMKANRWWFDDR